MTKAKRSCRRMAENTEKDWEFVLTKRQILQSSLRIIHQKPHGAVTGRKLEGNSDRLEDGREIAVVLLEFRIADEDMLKGIPLGRREFVGEMKQE